MKKFLIILLALIGALVIAGLIMAAGVAAITMTSKGGVSKATVLEIDFEQLIVEYVRDADDLALLLSLYDQYRALVRRAFEGICGAGGLGLMLHSYAPREVDVPVDEKIVERLRAAYAPDTVETWPLRAEVDMITRTAEGTRRAVTRLEKRPDKTLTQPSGDPGIWPHAHETYATN